MKYLALKKQKMEEIVTMLDLFEGKITLTELLNTDISLLNQLRDAKIEIKNRLNPEKNQGSNENKNPFISFDKIQKDANKMKGQTDNDK